MGSLWRGHSLPRPTSTAWQLCVSVLSARLCSVCAAAQYACSHRVCASAQCVLLLSMHARTECVPLLSVCRCSERVCSGHYPNASMPKCPSSLHTSSRCICWICLGSMLDNAPAPQRPSAPAQGTCSTPALYMLLLKVSAPCSYAFSSASA